MRHENEARRTFRSRDTKASLSEYEKEQRALHKNLERLRAERLAREAAKSAKSAAQNMLADPMLVAAGIQVIRAIGIKKLIPILAVGGLALGFLASRGAPGDDEAPAE